MVRRRSLPNYFSSKTVNSAASFFLAAGNKKFQRAMMPRNPPDDWLKMQWARDSQTRTRLVDSLFCIYVFARKQCIFSSALRHKSYLTPPYVTSIRDQFCLSWNFRVRLYQAVASQPASSRGCSRWAIIIIIAMSDINFDHLKQDTHIRLIRHWERYFFFFLFSNQFLSKNAFNIGNSFFFLNRNLKWNDFNPNISFN